jgi:hypothetical protein
MHRAKFINSNNLNNFDLRKIEKEMSEIEKELEPVLTASQDLKQYLLKQSK